MPARIRLQRFGKKKSAFFHIVVADSRSPRDGRFIEKLGTYNPNTNPATIDIQFERALHWVQTGAQPSDTCRAILSYKGVLYKSHLLKGVAKGAMTVEQAEAKYSKWATEKEGKITSKRTNVAGKRADESKKRLAAETAANEARIAKIAAKVAPAPAEAEGEAPAAESAE